ncbi:Triple functional domain protein [Manis javanica]|nr:Triple functional domain protein [Manis javanica]
MGGGTHGGRGLARRPPGPQTHPPDPGVLREAPGTHRLRDCGGFHAQEPPAPLRPLSPRPPPAHPGPWGSPVCLPSAPKCVPPEDDAFVSPRLPPPDLKPARGSGPSIPAPKPELYLEERGGLNRAERERSGDSAPVSQPEADQNRKADRPFPQWLVFSPNTGLRFAAVLLYSEGTFDLIFKPFYDDCSKCSTRFQLLSGIRNGSLTFFLRLDFLTFDSFEA